MRTFLRLLSSWKFLPNRKQVFFKNQKEAFREFCRVSGASLLVYIGFIAFVVEFAAPTWDIVYDIKRMISPDFDLYARYGEKAEYEMDFSNKIRMFKSGEKVVQHDRELRRPPEARFGGAV